MEDIKQLIDGISEYGEITKEVKVGNAVFEIKTLSTEEVIIANSIDVLTELHEHYGGAKNFERFNVAFTMARSIALASYFITKINGLPVCETKDPAERTKVLKEFRKTLFALPPGAVDLLIDEHAKITDEKTNVFRNIEETLGK